jgi:hypothetical protein
MQYEYRMLSGNRAHGQVRLMSNFGRDVKWFEAADAESALRSIAPDGWKGLVSLPHEVGSSWRILVRRPKQ